MLLRKTAPILFVTVLLFAQLLYTSEAQTEQWTLFVTPSPLRLDPGSVFTVRLNVTGPASSDPCASGATGTAIQAYDASLVYDATVLHARNATISGTLFDTTATQCNYTYLDLGTPTIHEPEGRVHVAMTFQGAAVAFAPGTLLVVEFEVLDLGMTDIELRGGPNGESQEASLVDVGIEAITHTESNGVFDNRVGNGPPPVANFTYQPAPAGQPFRFDASSSFDQDGGSLRLYRWRFGDGDTSLGVTVEHIYNQQGDYNVTLTVRDDEGWASDLTKTVHVDPAPPAPFDYTPYIIGGGIAGGVTGFIGYLWWNGRRQLEAMRKPKRPAKLKHRNPTVNKIWACQNTVEHYAGRAMTLGTSFPSPELSASASGLRAKSP